MNNEIISGQESLQGEVVSSKVYRQKDPGLSDKICVKQGSDSFQTIYLDRDKKQGNYGNGNSLM